MKKILGIALMLLVACSPFAMAARISGIPTVAVMDFGNHVGAATADIVMSNTDKTASDYIIEALVESGQYDVVDKEWMAEKLAAENLSTTGIIDPDTARRIGEILGVRYIIYGNLNDVTGSSTGLEVVSSGADVHTVKAHIIARMMDVETGEIVMAAKGEGKSKSSLAKLGPGNMGVLAVGTKKISQVSVHNSIKKAAYTMVSNLSARLFGTPAKKKK